MKKLVLLAALFFSGELLIAQSQAPITAAAPAMQTPKGNGRINGMVSDEETQKPIEFATVALFPETGDKPLDGTLCNEKGQFRLENLAPGNYRLVVSFIGYESKTISKITLEANNSEADLGRIQLKADAHKLNEVEIVTQRELFENKIDRMVYNAEKDISNAGGNASDVLKKVPQVTVDLEGNVQLRGSSNIKVLINNKPSSIMAASVSDALKQIPSDMIKSVEVITSPSAKYDAEGTAGIINIITKKTEMHGFNGSTYVSLGNLSSNVGVSANQRLGKLGLNANIGTNRWDVLGETEVIRNDYEQNAAGETQTNTLNQTADFKNGGRFNYLQFGADYDLNVKNSLNAGVRLNNSIFRNENDLLSRFSANQEPVSQFRRDIDTKNENNSVDVNLGYVRTFEKPQQELSLLALYSLSNRESLYNLLETNVDGKPTYREKNPNDNTNEETTFQLDYVQPLKEKQQLELGAKGILRNVHSDYRFFNDLTGTGELINRPERSDRFTYDQDVLASYVSYGFGLGKSVALKVGGRYEHTFIDADFQSTNNAVKNDYMNFMPNLMVAKDLSESTKLKLSYSRRIQRPLIFYLNPYVNSADTFNISFGNPKLAPELTDAFELNYNTFYKMGSVNASLYWRQTNNAIETVRFVDEKTNVASTTYQNIARNNTLGLSLFGSIKPIEKLSLSGNANFFYMQLNSKALQTKNANLQANFNLNASWQFKEYWAAEAFGFYNSPRVQLQGTVSGMRYYNFSVKREILKKKGSISVGLDNIFEQTTLVRTTYQTDNSDMQTDMNFYRRGVRVNFNYNFGKTQFKAPRKRSIRNDDVKGDGGNGGGQQ